MGAVTTTAFCLFCLQHAPNGSGDVFQWRDLISKAAEEHNLPQAWITHVMEIESGGRTQLGGKPITSAAGAMGLMQIMPATYDEMRRHYGLGRDPYDPKNSIEAGAAYLRELYGRYGYPALFAAYNAGPRRYEEYLFYGRSFPQETVAYMDKLTPGMSGSFRSVSTTLNAKPPYRSDALFFYHTPLSDGTTHADLVSNGVGSPGQGGGLFIFKVGAY